MSYPYESGGGGRKELRRRNRRESLRKRRRRTSADLGKLPLKREYGPPASQQRPPRLKLPAQHTQGKLVQRRPGDTRKAEERPNRVAMTTFFQCLATTVHSGVDVARSLELAGCQSGDPTVRAIGFRLADTVRTGLSLSQAMERLPRAFPLLLRRMVRVGEETGRLDHILEELASHEQTAHSTSLQVRKALFYPILVFVLAALASALLPPFLFGGIFDFIRQSGQELPWLTRVALRVSDLLRSPWPYLLGAAWGGGLWLLWPRIVTDRVRVALAAQLLRLPALGKLLREVASTRFARALALQIESGVTIDRALPLAARASGNILLEARIEAASAQLRQGWTLRDSLAGTDFFSPVFLQMCEAGEASGTTAKMLCALARLYDQNLEAAIGNFTAMIQPLATLALGAVVAVVVITPMLSIIKVMEAL